jgi:hypothetical protein
VLLPVSDSDSTESEFKLPVLCGHFKLTSHGSLPVTVPVSLSECCARAAEVELEFRLGVAGQGVQVAFKLTEAAAAAPPARRPAVADPLPVTVAVAVAPPLRSP